MSSGKEKPAAEINFGENLTDIECEALMIEKFGSGSRTFRKHFANELKLMSVKWFDYRIQHPVVSTYQFAKEYMAVYRNYYQKTIDCERGKYVKSFKGQDPWISSQAGGFIKGRQFADELGIPYDLFIGEAFSFLFNKKWHHLPRPCHLYADDVLESVAVKWEERKRVTMVLAKDDFFKLAINMHRPEFIAHQKWIEQYVSRSGAKKATIECLREKGFLFLPEDK